MNRAFFGGSHQIASLAFIPRIGIFIQCHLFIQYQFVLSSCTSDCSYGAVTWSVFPEKATTSVRQSYAPF